ncbi:MAG TPA: response regulator [Candidatus Limnocylindria bacterium]|nr:response regulator [Candidatus Limnocylindria bacterium]
MTTAIPGAGPGCLPRVAVVDADRRVQQSIADVLRIAGVDVVGTAGDPALALQLAAQQRPAVVLVDPRLPDVAAGEAFLRALGRDFPEVRVVLMGWNQPAELQLRSDAFVAKSAGPEEFVAAAIEACRG